MKPLVRPADVLTAVRLPLAAIFPFVRHPGWQLAVVGAAAASDYLDGVLARRQGGSRIGALLDPVVDKVFMLSAFLTVARSGLLAPLEIVVVLLRDLLATAAFLGSLVLRRPVALPARSGGKAVTGCQLLTLAAYIAQSPLVRPLAWATGAIGVYALWDYSRVVRRRS